MTPTDPTEEIRPARRTVLRAAGGLGLVGAATMLGGRALGVGDGRAEGSPGLAELLGSGARCDLTPEVTEGPFYLPGELVRRDIREDREGVLLRMRFHVVDQKTCEPLPKAAVDIWHCDALGEYSGVAMLAEGEDTDASDSFLRGIQVTDSSGVCTIVTIVPGWYPGRTTHIHVKVHVKGKVVDQHYEGGHVSHTGQVFFSEKLMALIEDESPYSQSQTRRLHNDADSIYHQAGGTAAIARTRARVKGDPSQGYNGDMVLTVDPKAMA